MRLKSRSRRNTSPDIVSIYLFESNDTQYSTQEAQMNRNKLQLISRWVEVASSADRNDLYPKDEGFMIRSDLRRGSTAKCGKL